MRSFVRGSELCLLSSLTSSFLVSGLELNTPLVIAFPEVIELSLLIGEGVTSDGFVTGLGVGSALATLALRVVLEPVNCFHEQERWIKKRTDMAPVAERVKCKAVVNDVDLSGEVFLHARKTTLFDGRFVLKGVEAGDKSVLVAWQDKHSDLGSKTKVSKSFILDCHKEVSKTLLN